jgi:hypothetical protein
MRLRLALLLLAIALHVLTGVFWTGAAFVVARFGPATGGLRLRRAQLLAATASIAIGAALWVWRRSEWGQLQAQVMGLGALAAIVAAGVQSGLGLPAARRLEGLEGSAARGRLAVVDWLSALLLGLAVVSMTLARYVRGPPARRAVAGALAKHQPILVLKSQIVIDGSADHGAVMSGRNRCQIFAVTS